MDTNHRSKHKIRSTGRARWCLFQVYKTKRQKSIAVRWTVCVYMCICVWCVVCEKRIEERETRAFLDACKAGYRLSKGLLTNANKWLASISSNGVVSIWKQAVHSCLFALVYLARIRLEIVHEQKRTKRTLSTEYRRNTSDIRDLLDSKLSSDSPPRAVVWHGFLVAVNFPLIVVQSIGLHVVAREGMHGRRKKHTLH